jgi:glutamate synthase domain-containing protein 1/glutamate synthase domain-containing protein 3
MSTIRQKAEAEGGCGVIGLACEERVAGKHLYPALKQMRNRGNGKGGGIAAAGMDPAAFGVTKEVLEDSTLLAIAYIDLASRTELEQQFIEPLFEVQHRYAMPHLPDYRMIEELEIKPPEVICYFVKVKPEVIERYTKEHPTNSLGPQAIADELVYHNSFQLNAAFYSSTGEKRAFVLSHGKNLLVLKMVGYGDEVVRYYCLEEFKAHVWIGHHRYPTKGRVWHPGGAHPFIGLNEALVHNGDFANYFSTCEYLAQRNIYPHFLTDTEVSALLFDLYIRTYSYPLEYVIEALAPTTERDFTQLPLEKQQVYEQLQKTHMHGSPDGPWFFLIAQSQVKPDRQLYRLIGITDTSMLRPQVFALQKGAAPIGLAASEKQAIDATLRSLSMADNRFWRQADEYWNARGGSHTDGGAFSFTIEAHGEQRQLICRDKFERQMHAESLAPFDNGKEAILQKIPALSTLELFHWVKSQLLSWDYPEYKGFLQALPDDQALELLTLLLDRRYPLGKMRRSCLAALLNNKIESLLTRRSGSDSSVIDAQYYAAEGPNSLALEVVKRVGEGHKEIIVFNGRGERFLGSGLGKGSHGVKIDLYGSSGDYLASGIDGAHLVVHGSGQDQLAQIMNNGTLVVYGDVGQAFMYGAKGGTAYILGNTAGRPLINAVGKPRVVINGTSLDYLAESFMAGIPLKGGGFVILNGIRFNQQGELVELETPYPGNNLFSLASGGAIYIRDPARKLVKEQLNGGQLSEMTEEDWTLLLPYLKENERLFNISIERLLQWNGKAIEFHKAYRKVSPSHLRVLQEEEMWVKAKEPGIEQD